MRATIEQTRTRQQKLRVLHVLEATLGGTRRYLDDLRIAVRGRGIESMLAYSESRADTAFPQFLAAAQADAWTTVNLHMTREIAPMRDIRAVARLRSTIGRLRPDVVHAHSSKAGAIARLAVLSLPNRPSVVYSPHALAFRLNRKYLTIESLLAPLTGRFAAVSQSERAEIANCGLADASSIDIISPSIDPVFYSPSNREAARSALNLGANPLLLSIGRITEQKDPLAFVAIVAAVRERIPDVRALWVGDGDLRAEVQREIDARGLHGVIQIVAWQSDVRPYFAAADVVVSTARYESFGYTVPEALAMERPVVASAVTGTIDILTGPLRLLLFPQGEPLAAADRVVSLLTFPANAASLARAGRKIVVDRYSSSAMGDALERLYTTVMEVADAPERMPAARRS